MIHGKNLAEFESKIAALTQEMKISADSTLTHHYLLYWKDSQQIHFCYLNDQGRRHDWDERTLLAESAKLNGSDPLVANALRIVSLQDDLKENHPALSPELMASLFTLLKQKRYLFIPFEGKSPLPTERRIIRQINSQETIYYGEWFLTPAGTASSSLPGRWTAVYPFLTGEIKESQGEGWVQLDRAQHAELWLLLEEQDLQQRRQRSYAAVCALYAAIDKQLSTDEFSTALVSTWHLTTAESAAAQQRWFYSALGAHSVHQPPTAITSGCLALATLEQDVKTSESTQLAPCRHLLDQWTLTMLRQIYSLLLPVCQSRFSDTLSPWRLKTKSLSYADFEKSVTALIILDQQLLWADPSAVQQIYAEFNRLCAQKQSDLLSQLHRLTHETKSTSADHQLLQNWRQIWQKLLQQWRQCGYHSQVSLWKDVLQKKSKTQESWLKIMEPENSALTLLQSGLETLTSTHAAAKIPDTWEQAHLEWRRILQNYAGHGQKTAFYHAKNQYQARLESYQVFLISYCQLHSDYQPWLQWCEQRLAEIKTVTPVTFASQLTPPATWPWQTIRAKFQSEKSSDSEKTLIAVLNNLWLFLQNFLGEPPCDYEVMVMKSISRPDQWRVHLLVAQNEKITQPYFLVLAQVFTLYHALLPLHHQWTIKCYTPQQLGGVYCPALPESEDLELADPQTFLPVLYFANSKNTQPRKLCEAYVIHLHQRLQEVAQQAEIRENKIRNQHHALTTQPLVKTEGPFSDAKYALEQRQQAHRKIDRLKNYVRDRYAPLIDLMVYFAVEKPEWITACLQKISVELTQQDEKKASSVQPSLYLLLYRHLPRIWKPRFIQQLEQYWKTPSLLQTQCLRQLRHDPDDSGWRYRMQAETERWQTAFHTLLSKEEKTTSSDLAPVMIQFIENGELQQARLCSEAVEQLLDFKSSRKDPWRPKDSKVSGRHQVYKVSVTDRDGLKRNFWFKLDPEQPGTEYLVQQIDWRLGVFGTALQQLVKITIGDQPGIPVLVSEDVAGVNLSEILAHQSYQLANISPLSFVSTLIRVIVINPEDDKYNDYF